MLSRILTWFSWCSAFQEFSSLLVASRPILLFSISRDRKLLWGNSIPSRFWHQIKLRLFLILAYHLRIPCWKIALLQSFFVSTIFSTPSTCVAHITFLCITYLLLKMLPRIHAFGVKAAVVWTPLLTLCSAKVNNRWSYTSTAPTPLSFHGITLNYANGQDYFYVYL
jgi:hypothetical protein